MAKICELCKTTNSDENQFCDKCGNPLGEVKPEAAQPTEHDRAKAEAAKRRTGKNLFWVAIAIVVLIGAFFGYNYMREQKLKEQATQVVINYLMEVRAGNYSKALEIATGTGLSPEWEAAFKEYMNQLTPAMGINDKLVMAKTALSVINDGMVKYEMINGRYPQKLDDLVTPQVLDALPSLPGYEYGYEYDSDADNYTIFIKGNNFKLCNLPDNYPAFSKKDRLQSPGERKSFGEWKLTDYEIIDANVSGDKVSVIVKERSQFGPTINVSDDVYEVIKKQNRWYIDPASSRIDKVAFLMGFTDMKQRSEDKKSPKTMNSIGMMLLSFLNIAEDPKNIELRRKNQLRNCRIALDTLALALNRLYRDNNGEYPDSLQWLIPKYIDKIPDNPAAMEDTFTKGYEVSADREAFTIYAGGTYYRSIGIEDNFPLYSSFYRYVQKSSDIKNYVPVPEGLEKDKEEEKTEKATKLEETKIPETSGNAQIKPELTPGGTGPTPAVSPAAESTPVPSPAQTLSPAKTKEEIKPELNTTTSEKEKGKKLKDSNSENAEVEKTEN